MALSTNQMSANLQKSIILESYLSNMKGHNGRVRSVVWSSDDQKIISCGTDGAVYEWEVSTGKRYVPYIRIREFWK